MPKPKKRNRSPVARQPEERQRLREAVVSLDKERAPLGPLSPVVAEGGHNRQARRDIQRLLARAQKVRARGE